MQGRTFHGFLEKAPGIDKLTYRDNSINVTLYP